MRLVLIYIICFISAAVFASDWELEKNRNGVKIYTRSSALSDFKEYKGVVYINASRQQVAKTVLDIRAYRYWFPDCEESSVLRKLSDNEVVVYYKINCPWPTMDRDAVVYMNTTYENEKNQITIDFKEQRGFKSEVDDAIRVRNTEGYWQFTTENGKTKVVYQCLTDPAGSIPAWVANLFIVDAPYNTLIALKNRLEK